MRLIILVVLTVSGNLLLSSMRPAPVETSPVVGLGKVEVSETLAAPAIAAKEVTATFKAPVAKAPQPAPASPGGDIESIVRAAARKYGLNEEHFVSIARCESNMTPSSVNLNYNENGHPSGLFQHLSGYYPARAAKYGYSPDVFDAYSNANTTAAMFKDGQAGLWECT